MPASPPRLVREPLAPADLTPALLDELWAFVSAYCQRRREAFEAALPGYAHLSLWRARDDGRLLGFAANKPLPLRAGGREVLVIYSGWAILAPEIRGTNLIQREGLRCFLLGKLRHPFRPAFWVFGASTYKSYLLLPRNFTHFDPRPDAAWDEGLLAVRDGLMAALADPHWDPVAGVIRRHGASRYREGVVADDPAALADPDVAFYAGANPGQDEGDTLLAVVPLSPANWATLLRRSLGRGKRRRG